MTAVVQRRWFQGVFFASGAAGLIAQVVWVRACSAALGHELPALLGVVTAFFAGLAAGAAGFDSWIRRSRQPARWYAALEWLSAGWIVMGTAILFPACDWVLRRIGLEPTVWRQGLLSFALPLVLIGPAAAGLGGTFPAMERAMAPLMSDQRAVAILYGWNTAGAVLGVGLAVGVLMPVAGFQTSLWFVAGLQAVCGCAVLWVTWRTRGTSQKGSAPGSRDTRAVSRESGPSPAMRTVTGGALTMGRIGVTAFLTGLLGLGFELLGVRALAQTTENTVHTFAAALAVFLSGTAAGATLVRMAHRRGRVVDIRLLVAGLGTICLAEIWVIALSPGLLALGSGVFGPYGGEIALSAAVFLIPTLFMGAIFAEVVQRAGQLRGSVGRTVALNTVGAAAAGPLVFGILPGTGLKWGLVLIAAGYLALVPRPWRGWPVAVGGVAVLLALALPRQLQLIDLPQAAQVVRYLEGRLATVAVVRTADGHRTLRVNNHFQQGGTATASAARRHAHLPLLLHPAPRRALFLGVGTGVTMGAAVAHPEVRADGVELLPEVAAVLSEFQPENGLPEWGERLRVSVADARRYVRCTTNRYDVIVADLFHPSEDGAGFLYTRDHFAAMRARLAPGGLVCQWLGLHQLDRGTFAAIVRTFLEVFPESTLWLLRANVDLPVVGLVGAEDRLRCDPVALSVRIRHPALSKALGSVGMNDPVRILGWLLAGPEDLRRMAGTSPVATDDLPHVLFRAPAAAYHPDESPATRLSMLLRGWSPAFREILPEALPGGWLGRLEAFRAARDYHLNGLITESAGRLDEAIEAYVRSAAASPDYTAGYAQAILVASAYSREQPDFAKRLLRRLMEVRPELGLAGEMLERLD